ncbi:MAG TPA: CopD family protein [Burkholderiales bacterium]|nr:CopD family protein [Burkholderiales bacterium]
MAIAITLHILFAVIWVGGMFFAVVALRPVAATVLKPPQRLPLWAGTFTRFFPWIWAAAAILPATGYWLVFRVFEGFENAGLHVQIMQFTGWIMIAIFLHIYFAPFQRFKKAVAARRWPSAAEQLAQIRMLVGINLVLGLITTVIATGGRYLGDFWFAVD